MFEKLDCKGIAVFREGAEFESFFIDESIAFIEGMIGPFFFLKFEMETSAEGDQRDPCFEAASESACAAWECAVVFGERDGNVADLKSETVCSFVEFSARENKATSESGTWGDE